MLLNYCKKNCYEIYDFYVDEDYSGINTDRPEFNRMLKDAEAKCFDTVICKTMSRFSRDISTVDNLINNKFMEMGIRFISVVDNTDSYDKNNKKTRQINSLINEWYLEDLSENIRAVFKDKMRKGECLFAFAPYGYQKNPEKKNQLIKDVNTEHIVRLIYWLYNFGCGTAKIAEMLNIARVISPLNYRNKVDGYNWTGGTVKDILTNPVYCGNLVQNRKNKLSYKSRKRVSMPENEWICVRNTHESIIDENIYLLTQAKIKNGQRSSKDGFVNPLSGLFECECGGSCVRKNKKIICRRCQNSIFASEVMESVCKKLHIKENNTLVVFAVVQSLTRKIILGNEQTVIVWK